jgi:hypothetical protein
LYEKVLFLKKKRRVEMKALFFRHKNMQIDRERKKNIFKGNIFFFFFEVFVEERGGEQE